MTLSGTPEFQLFTLILMRMSGFVFLNPVFGRKNIPAMFKAAMAFLLAVVVYPSAETAEVRITSVIVYSVLLLKEFALGFVLGMVMQIFEMAVTYAGAVIDFQMGMSMATVYDAQNGTQVAMTGNILQIYMWLLFFAVDGHLALLKIVMTSGQVVPYAGLTLGRGAAAAVLTMFADCILLAVKLALPIIAFELLMEVGIGILMRIIPQINLFAISIQLRLILGFVILIILISPIGDYLGNVIASMVDALQDILTVMGG